MLSKPREEDKQKERQGETVETDILKRVIRENWKASVGGVERLNKGAVTAYDEHAQNMRKLLNTLDYEIISMPNIVSNTKRMQKDEIAAYLAAIEALAVGYYDLLDKELTSLVMIGLSYKAKDISTMLKYLASLTAEIEARVNAYKGRATRESRRLDLLYAELKQNESSIMRIFKRKRITSLRDRAGRRTSRFNKLNVKVQRYSDLLNDVKARSKQGSKKAA